MSEFRVAIVRCSNYEPSEVRVAVEAAVDLIGGIESFISEGGGALAKPNLLSARPPEKAVTTHPAVVEAVLDLCKESRINVHLGDSPPIAAEKESGYKRILDKTGMSEVAARIGVPVVRFEEASVKVSHPDGRYYRSFEIAQAVMDADIILNLPKLKTHGLTYLSGAVKNLFGCVPGRRKALFHAQAGEDRETFSQMLVDLLGVLPPTLTIMDAVTAMDGDGPTDGRPRHLGIILAGDNPVAVDAVASAIFGIDPLSIHTTRLASEQGLGTADLKTIQTLGVRIEDVAIRDFQMPRSKDIWRRLPPPIRRVLKKHLIPYPKITKACRNCLACVDGCPVKTIESREDRPEIDLSRCIRCYCCREVCEYSAIDLSVSRLSNAVNLVRRARRKLIRLITRD